jgi:hypothetical protein
MRLTVCRKARRRGHAIAVGAVSQSWPSVGWIGKVSSGCADSVVERKQVRKDRIKRMEEEIMVRQR